MTEDIRKSNKQTNGFPSESNRGFQLNDPQKQMRQGGAHSGGNFADDSESANTGQLRDAIDHGEKGDNVNASDPAAAPLGADSEAGLPSGRIRFPEDTDDSSENLRRPPKLPT